MAALTFLVWFRLYFERLTEMKAKRVHPQKVANRADAAKLLSNTQALDHYANLFEAPVLFYFTLAAIAVAKLDLAVLLPLAWAFVALRAAHALVHLTYNKVMHRFYAFFLGSVCLWIFIARAAWQLGHSA
ncbi:MAG: MAPEG family protein [Ahniella sp.]|nr:MAPEG family protein [Ahniella sp.]